MTPRERQIVESILREVEDISERLKKLLLDNPKPVKLVVPLKITQWDMSAAHYLDACLQVNIRGWKPREDKVLVEWADDFRLLRTRDGRKESDIEEILKWVVKSDFWKRNIKSGAKFRKQYENLLAAKQTEEDKAPNLA